MIPRALAISIVAAGFAHAAGNPVARYRLLSEPDCPGPANIIAEAAPEPLNQTFVRVQHIGDPGTQELAGEVDNEITWDVGTMTGLHVNPFYQRGYRDAPPPVAASAFQLACESAGFLINSSQFSHSQPLYGEGPSASIARTLDPAPVAFDDERSVLAIDGWVSVPTSQSPALAPGSGTAQVSFIYYVQDVTTRINIAHVINLFDNRAPGMGGAGVEFLGNDGITAFAGSPLAVTGGDGNPVRFVQVPEWSARIRYGQTWNESVYFRAEIPYARFKAMLEALNASSLPGSQVSTDPRNYRVLLFGAGGEIMVGTTREHEAMLGASVRSLTLSRERAEPRLGFPR